ncbi:alpha-L-fucosidase [Mucilaginibacter pocheonensis]|uniref:alpha-L-fucosidase n=1 Tax=Mucilaginibacter pocheonensis TaxID=398050 RepID=A0ABU1TDR4_9SPHI|nr:alpha-L-fucosidase [Mucilaginibacter pocheonensis]MDR6943548.1 alpha-L-fucosidase [Mucilaginibacter pocheonensis]
MKKLFTLLFLSFYSVILMAQKHNVSKQYVPPGDPLVEEKISKWQDLKFGLFMHWGTYSQWGVVESWSICPEDEGWTQRRGPYSATYNGYKTAYENLQTTFNPVKFNPEKWVKAAKDAGMKYVIFTTKHHDGFCMFDTKETDYKITSTKTPFSANPRSNVTKEIFDAFRKENFMVGAYFSKPDWHTENYWWPYFPPKDRNVNYDPKKHPERWQKFKDFTYNQISELMTGYGKVDILWLDGGWVRPKSSIDTSVDWQRGITYDQDIDMPKIAAMGRQKQPGLIVVDRTVSGQYENYTTPEQEVPEVPLDHPWESCITMGNSWSYVPRDHYKSVQQIVQLLVKIVSRGGNLLMNIGPGPDGDWDPVAYERLKGISDWMKVNGEGIYNSKSVAPYSTGNIFYTKAKNDKAIYAFVLSDQEKVALPASISVKVSKPKKVTLLGSSQRLKWKQQNDEIVINIPAGLQQSSNLKEAACFKLEY